MQHILLINTVEWKGISFNIHHSYCFSTKHNHGTNFTQQQFEVMFAILSNHRAFTGIQNSDIRDVFEIVWKVSFKTALENAKSLIPINQIKEHMFRWNLPLPEEMQGSVSYLWQKSTIFSAAKCKKLMNTVSLRGLFHCSVEYTNNKQPFNACVL